eukprot:Lankesteria_metandrocarpae@DN5651_c0_g1_i1.p1
MIVWFGKVSSSLLGDVNGNGLSTETTQQQQTTTQQPPHHNNSSGDLQKSNTASVGYTSPANTAPTSDFKAQGLSSSGGGGGVGGVFGSSSGNLVGARSLISGWASSFAEISGKVIHDASSTLQHTAKEVADELQHTDFKNILDLNGPPPVEMIDTDLIFLPWEECDILFVEALAEHSDNINKLSSPRPAANANSSTGGMGRSTNTINSPHSNNIY